MFEDIPNSIQIFNLPFVEKIKDLYTDKVYEKCCLVIYINNNKEKNFIQ